MYTVRQVNLLPSCFVIKFQADFQTKVNSSFKKYFVAALPVFSGYIFHIWQILPGICVQRKGIL